MTPLNKAAVIGAGVMGSTIAAQIANAGVPVLLLDIVPTGAARRNQIADKAVADLKKTKPAALMHKSFAKRITPGNIEDDLDQLADCDWIIEVVIERLDIKQDLYRKIEAVRRPGSLVTSNTSTMPLRQLVAGLPDSFARDFAITHFFNPPRYMRLLEVVAGPQTRPDAVAALHDIGDRLLGKDVVDCHDTPGFIANRIGIYWIEAATAATQAFGLTIEQADLVAGRPMGFPKTGIYGLLDLVGLDLSLYVAKSMADILPDDDPYHALHRDTARIEKMVAAGYTGRKGKGKGGFYRMRKTDGKKVKEVLDFDSGDYRPVEKAAFDSVKASKSDGLRALLAHDDPGGRFAWAMLSKVLAYAAALVPEIADDIVKVDAAMRDGYAWKYGPFELIDRIGPQWFADRLRGDGMAVPPLLDAVGAGTFYDVADGRQTYFGTDHAYHPRHHPQGVLLLADIKRGSEPVAANASASVWDLGDGVACLEFHTKMNSIDPDMLEMVGRCAGLIPKKGFKALVIYNEGTNFSAGANIGLLLQAANTAMWDQIEMLIAGGQAAYRGLKYAPFPVVGAPHGLTLGGGCELMLHCDAIHAHAETYIGLVEVGVGVVPGWGGCKEMLLRWQTDPAAPKGPMAPVTKAFEMISMAKVATSAAEAKSLNILRETDGYAMNAERVLAEAKAKALALAIDYMAPEPPEIRLPGLSGKLALNLAVSAVRKVGKATDHDVTVTTKLAEVLSGGDTDVTDIMGEDDLLTLERQAFGALIRDEKTLLRIEHMLMTGKPLRN